MGAEKPSRPQRQGRRTPLLAAVAAVAVAVAAAPLSAWYRYPQPELELSSARRLASAHVGATPANHEAGAPLNGTVIVITGATSGIGLELASKLHESAATIAAIGRSPSKLERLRIDLDGEGTAETKKARLVPFVADLNDLQSVARAADEIRARFRKVDFLVNNAGMHYGLSDFVLSRPTAQGYDMVFGVNYLSHFLLTEKLLPLLQRSNRNPRIIQISSSFHWLSGGYDLASEDGQPPYAAQNVRAFFHRLRSYPHSKLAQILHSRALSRELRAAPSHIKVISVCPGWVSTKIGGRFNHIIMSHMAYPPDGFGLASALDAMFHPGAGVEGMDWVINNRLFDHFGKGIVDTEITNRWASEIGLRDLITWMVAVASLYAQKFFGEVIWTKSSPETYDIELQDSLYQWSKDAVSEWL